MDHFSLTIPLHQTIPSSLAPTSLYPTSVPPSSFILPQHLVMSGVTKSKAGAGAKAPRPPNAWIIYRSDKLQNMPPPPEGKSRTQADVSKIISAQWRAESAEVRAMYDDRAEIAKAEHARMYPDYRFAPMKKADKERIREEKRQAKEQERAGRKVRARVAPYPLPSAVEPFKTTSSLIIKHVVPNTNSTSPSMSSSASSSSLLSMIPDSQLGLNVAQYYDSTRVSLDASTDAQFQFVGSQDPSFNEALRLGAAAPSESSSSMVPQSHNLTFSISQPPPHEDWLPSPSAELSPLSDVPEWQQPPPSTQDQPRQVCPLHFTMPSLETELLPNELIEEAARSCAIPGVFPLHALANGDITVPPPGNVNMGMGMYPSSMSGSGAFDDSLQLLGENSDTFMSNPTVEKIVATINTLSESPQSHENSSSDSESIDLTQAFNIDDFVEDFGAPASQGCESFDPVEERTGLAEPYVPPRDAANAGPRRVGGTWKVPMAIGSIASPNQVMA